MDAIRTAVIIVHLIICASLVCVVIFQSGKSSGLSGAIGGGADTFLSKNQSKSPDAKLARATKWVAGVFVILTIILNLI